MAASPHAPLFDPETRSSGPTRAASWGYTPTRRCATATTSPCSTPRASPRCPAPSPPTRRLSTRYTARRNTVAVVTDGTAVLGLGDIGPLGGHAGHGGQGGAVQAVRRRRRRAGVHGDRHRRRARRGGRADRARRSAASTSRTSRRRAASRSSAGSRSGSTSRSSTTTSTAPRSWCSPACSTPRGCVGRQLADLRVVVSGAGAAGVAVTPDAARGRRRATSSSCDSRGIISPDRAGPRPATRRRSPRSTNPRGVHGALGDALAGADVFIGVSGGTVPEDEPSRRWRRDAIVFALANPDPEVHPDVAARHAAVVATGRSRLPEPDQQRAGLPRHLPRGARRRGAPQITEEMKLAGRARDRRPGGGADASTASCRACSRRASPRRSRRGSCPRPECRPGATDAGVMRGADRLPRVLAPVGVSSGGGQPVGPGRAPGLGGQRPDATASASEARRRPSATAAARCRRAARARPRVERVDAVLAGRGCRPRSTGRSPSCRPRGARRRGRGPRRGRPRGGRRCRAATESHCPKVGDPTRMSTTKSTSDAARCAVTYFACDGGTSAKWMPRTVPRRRDRDVGLRGRRSAWPMCLGEWSTAEALEEDPAVVGELARGDLAGAGDRERLGCPSAVGPSLGEQPVQVDAVAALDRGLGEHARSCRRRSSPLRQAISSRQPILGPAAPRRPGRTRLASQQRLVGAGVEPRRAAAQHADRAASPRARYASLTSVISSSPRGAGLEVARRSRRRRCRRSRGRSPRSCDFGLLRLLLDRQRPCRRRRTRRRRSARDRARGRRRRGRRRRSVLPRERACRARRRRRCCRRAPARRGSSPMKSAPMMNAWASPSGCGCTAYAIRCPTARRRRAAAGTRGWSCGVVMTGSRGCRPASASTAGSRSSACRRRQELLADAPA